MSDKIEITREVVTDYLIRKGYRDGLEGTKKLAEFVYLCYQMKIVKGEKIDYGEIAKKVAKKYKCEPGSITQNTRYLCVTKFPNKSRSEVIEGVFLSELALLAETNRTTVISGSRIEYFQDDANLRSIMMFLVSHDFDILHSLDIYIERPEYGGALSPFYEIGIMDSKKNRVALRNPSAMTVGEGARNQRLAAIYFCFDTIRYIYKETNRGNSSVTVRPFCNVQDFYQGAFFDKLSVE